MPVYIVVTPLRHRAGEKPTPPGEPVMLAAGDGDALIALGAVTQAPDGAAVPIAGTTATGTPGGEGVQLAGGTDPAGQPLPPVAKPLATMKRPELAVEATKAGVEIAIGMTNKQIVAAIEAKRAEQA